MRKWILGFVALLAIIIVCIYLFIPSPLRVSQPALLSVNTKTFLRTFPAEFKWLQWWPEKSAAALAGNYVYHGYTYRIKEKRITSLVIEVADDRDSFQTELFFIPSAEDTMALKWTMVTATPALPLARWQQYNKCKALKEDFATVLQHLQRFYSKEENIYDVVIKKETVRDSALISTSVTLATYPDTKTIYSLVEKLKMYAAKNGAAATGLPMLNIFTKDSTEFKTQVALPLDRILKGEGDIVYRWMLGRGNILVTEVKGGPYTINTAFSQMDNYVTDFKRTAPAIPFQSLVTDRRLEPDTAKWVTKLYWPVM